MDIISKKNAINQYILRAKSLACDSNTFLKVRVERTAYVGEDIGGGNLLMALGLFSAINYLAKVYVLLNGYCRLPDANAIEEAKSVYRGINNKFKDFLILIKRKDSVNETDAFSKLLSDKNCPQNLGIDEKEYAKVYHDTRNYLAHRIAPKSGYTMMTFQTNEGQEIPFGQIKKAISESGRAVFEKREDGHWDCYVDILIRDVEKIADWLISELGATKYAEDNIDITFKWLEGQYES